MHTGYLITELDGPTLVRFICCIGETRDFLKRHKEHLTQMLGADYGVFRADAVTAGAPTTRESGCP